MEHEQNPDIRKERLLTQGLKLQYKQLKTNFSEIPSTEDDGNIYWHVLNSLLFIYETNIQEAEFAKNPEEYMGFVTVAQNSLADLQFYYGLLKRRPDVLARHLQPGEAKTVIGNLQVSDYIENLRTEFNAI